MIAGSATVWQWAPRTKGVESIECSMVSLRSVYLSFAFRISCFTRVFILHTFLLRILTEPGIVQFGGVTVVKCGFRQFLLRSVGCSAPFLDTARSWLHSGTGDHGQVLTREQKSIKGTLGISFPFGARFMVMLGFAHGNKRWRRRGEGERIKLSNVTQ